MGKRETYYNIRDSKGRFVKVNKEEKDLKYFTSVDSVKLNVTDIIAHNENFPRTVKEFKEKFETTRPTFQEGRENVIKHMEEIGQHIPSWMRYEDRSKPKDYDAIDKETFNYSIIAETNYGLSEERQLEIFNKFKEANAIIEKIREQTGDHIGFPISYNLEIPSDRLESRLARANEYINGDYVTRISIEYKEDFKNNFKEHLTKEMYDELVEAIDSLTDLEFLKMLKNTRYDSLAYAIQSIIKEFGYEFLIGEVKAIISYSKMGELYE